MPDWAPVPNLPSVQATVASAQPAHLQGVDHIDPDGFGRGFTSVMNMRKIAGQQELWKLIQQSTGKDGVINWTKYNQLAAADKNPDLALVATEFEDHRRGMQTDQAKMALDLASQRGQEQALINKGVINQTQANQLTENLNKLGNNAGVANTGGSPQGYLDGLKATMLQHVTNIPQGNQTTMVTQDVNNHMHSTAYPIYLSPDQNANLQSHPIPTTDNTQGQTITKTNIPTYTNKGNLKSLIPIATTTSTNADNISQYDGYKKQSTDALNNFNKNQSNALHAVKLLLMSQNQSSVTPELAKLAQKAGINVKAGESTSTLAQKYLASMEREAANSGHSNSVEALKTAQKSLGMDAPYRLVAMAVMNQYLNDLADKLKYATAQNTKDYKGYDQIYNKTIQPNLMNYARAIAMDQLYRSDERSGQEYMRMLNKVYGKNYIKNLMETREAIINERKKDARIDGIGNAIGYRLQ